MSGYVIVKLYKDLTWAPSTVTVEDYPEANPWGRDDRGSFRYVRLPRSMWNSMEEFRHRRQVDGYLPPLLAAAEMMVDRLAAALLCRH